MNEYIFIFFDQSVVSLVFKIVLEHWYWVWYDMIRLGEQNG